jgi:heme-degrading monooxygenase HmoA
MIARVLEGEIDAVRMSLDDAVDVVRGSVVPALREQKGYGGMYLLLTDEGKALAISLWTTEEAADAGVVDSRRQYEAHRENQQEFDSAIDELERKAGALYTGF